MAERIKAVIVLMILSVIFLLPSGSNATEIFFSEYIEGSSYNKALEVYNPTLDDIDLTQYSIAIYSNGNDTITYTLALGGTLSANDTYVISYSRADETILALSDLIDSALNFNGDDAIVLYKGDIVIDSIGRIGEDPGSEWGTDSIGTQDNTLRRLAGITEGDTDPYDIFDPSLEWEGLSIDTFDGLGTHQTTDPVPEPATMLLLGAGFIVLAGLKRRRSSGKVDFTG